MVQIEALQIEATPIEARFPLADRRLRDSPPCTLGLLEDTLKRHFERQFRVGGGCWNEKARFGRALGQKVMSDQR